MNGRTARLCRRLTKAIHDLEGRYVAPRVFKQAWERGGQGAIPSMFRGQAPVRQRRRAGGHKRALRRAMTQDLDRARQTLLVRKSTGG